MFQVSVTWMRWTEVRVFPARCQRVYALHAEDSSHIIGQSQTEHGIKYKSYSLEGPTCKTSDTEKTYLVKFIIMPVLPTSTSSTFSHITVSKLHPTFGAEISGVDFTRPVEEEVFAEILAATAQVGLHPQINSQDYGSNETSLTQHERN